MIIVKAGNTGKVLAVYADGQDRDRLRALAAERHAVAGGESFLVPWTSETVAVLEDAGAEGTGWRVPPGETFPLVEGRYPVMPHQAETAGFLARHPRAYCTSTMRTGKTASAVLALDRIHRPGGTALVICPVSVMSGVWERTFRLTVPRLRTVILRGSRERRRALLAAGADVFIVNYDGVPILEREFTALKRAGRLEAVVVDELSHYGNMRSQRWKALERVVNRDPRVPCVWGLTGTPGADVMAVVGYANLVNPERMPWRTAGAWQTAVRYKFGREDWMWRDLPTAPETVRQVLQPNIRFRKSDVLRDLPPVTRTRREAMLSRAQESVLTGLKREMLALTASGAVVKADKKAALVSKLFQAAAGAVITAGGGTEEIDWTPRWSLILELVRSTERKTVIFCAFRAVVEALARRLNREGVSAAAVTGDVTGRARDGIFAAFQEAADPRVLVAHPVTTAYGTELAAADQLILNGPLMSGTHVHMQGLERLGSARQTSDRISIVELVASQEEALFFDSLDGRVGQADAVARLFEHVTGGKP